MDNHNKLVKEQLLHLLVGTGIFIALAGAAVVLDLASNWLLSIGVSAFTHSALAGSAHLMLVLDLVLFGVYLSTSSYKLIKEMVK